MELRLRVETTAGHASEVVAGPWILMLWERKYKTKVSRVPTEGLGLEDMAYMAYEALKVQKADGLPATFDLFAQSISSLEMIGDEATPTPAAPSAG